MNYEGDNAGGTSSGVKEDEVNQQQNIILNEMHRNETKCNYDTFVSAVKTKHFRGLTPMDT